MVLSALLLYSLYEQPINISNRQEASQEIKVKSNESWLLKFYQVKQLKENSTEISAEKITTEDSKFNENWNISTKLKRKEKFSNSKNFVSWTLSLISSNKLL